MLRGRVLSVRWYLQCSHLYVSVHSALFTKRPLHWQRLQVSVKAKALILVRVEARLQPKEPLKSRGRL